MYFFVFLTQQYLSKYILKIYKNRYVKCYFYQNGLKMYLNSYFFINEQPFSN